MVRAEDPPVALKGLLAKVAGLLVLTQPPQGSDQDGRRVQGDGVVGAEGPPAVLEGVLAKAATLGAC